MEDKLNINDISVDVDQNGNDALYNQKGNFMGWGGPGKVTVVGDDPTGGSQKDLVSAGFDQVVNGVSEKRVGLPGWNKKKVESSDGGQSVGGVTAPAEKRVEIPSSANLAEQRAKKRAESELAQQQKLDAAKAVDEADEPIPTTGEYTGVDDPSVVSEKELDTEKGLNPASSDTVVEEVVKENGGQKETDNGGQSDDVPSEADYLAAKKRKDDAMSRGEVASIEDWRAVYKYENKDSRGKKPDEPVLAEPDDAPELKSTDASFRDAYSKYLEKLREAELDPASKAKRYRAQRAQRIVAALGDLLQAAANMWGAYKGADSAKLTSMSKSVSDSIAKKDALNLKKAAQLAKELETDLKRGESMTKLQNQRLLELWKAGLANTREQNRVAIHNFDKMLDEYKSREKAYQDGLVNMEKEWYKEYNASQSRKHAKEMEATRNANRMALKKQGSHVYHHGNGGKGKNEGEPV